MSKNAIRKIPVPFHEGGTFDPKPGNFTGGKWKYELNQKAVGKEVYSVFSSEKGLDGMKKCVSACFVRGQARGIMMTKKEARANAKLIAQAKNNLRLLQELESLYVNKELINGLSIFERTLLENITIAIKKSI